MPAADDAFVPLARLLRGEPAAEFEPPAEAAASAPPVAVAAPDGGPADPERLREIRIFHARLTEAFEQARGALLHELAYAVLGRELLLAPCDLEALAARIIAEHPAAQPLQLRVAPDDVAVLAAHAPELPPLHADATLAAGDAVLDLTCGHIDARLGVRIAALLAGCA